MAARNGEGSPAFGWAALGAAATLLLLSLPRGTLGRVASRTVPGHGADNPSDIPARGWWDIARRVFADLSDNRLMTEAAGITFYALLSIFPAMAALVSLAGLVLDPAIIRQDVGALGGMLPGGGMDLINDQLNRLTASPNGALSFGFAVGILASLWSANQGVKAMFDSLNKVYGEDEKRGYIFRTLLSLAFTIAALLFVIVAMAFVVVLPAVLGFLGLSSLADLAVRIVRWPVLLVGIGAFLACLYRYGPSRAHPKWRWVTWGSGFAAIVWIVMSVAFSWYVAHFGSYNKTYGSLGAVVGFMTWIWLSALVVLIGGQLDAEMEYQTTSDTTEGAPKPIGARGAVKADTAPVSA